MNINTTLCIPVIKHPTVSSWPLRTTHHTGTLTDHQTNSPQFLIEILLQPVPTTFEIEFCELHTRKCVAASLLVSKIAIEHKKSELSEMEEHKINIPSRILLSSIVYPFL